MNIPGLEVPISVLVGLAAAIVSAAIALRSLAQQRRLAYLQSILQVSANRVRLQLLLSSIRYLSAFERLFPERCITDQSVEALGTKPTDHYDILTLTIYAKERLFTVRNIRVKHDDPMETYQEYLFNSEWLSWKTSGVVGGTHGELVPMFKAFLRQSADDGTSNSLYVEYFSAYVRKLVVWCLLEPQFDMIFAVAPRIRRKIESIVVSSLEAEESVSWMDVEKQIHMFYQGKKW